MMNPIRLPFQLAFDFHPSKVEKNDPSEVPIDRSFPEDAANKLAALETYNKHLYRPNTYLHKWWARRSGTTFRYILKQLVDTPEKRDFYEGEGLEGKLIFDPMIGGGTTLHEAIRMGANVMGVDIDPIPTLQAKASLSQSSLKHKKDIYNEFIQSVKSKLAPFFKTACPVCNINCETQFTLYGLRRKCSCREVIFVDRLLLRQGNEHDIQICPSCHDLYTNKTHRCQSVSERPLMVKGTRKCEKCNTAFADILDKPFVERYVPLVNTGVCPEHGAFFKIVDHEDLALMDQAAVHAQKLKFGDSQDFLIPNGPKSKDLLRRGIYNFQDLFTPRQRIYLGTSLDGLSKLPLEDRRWLALLISTSLEFNSLLCGYKGSDIRRPGAIRHVFSHHAFSFPYTALENNPVFSGNTSGTLNRLFNDRILRAAKWAVEPVETQITGNRRSKLVIHGEIDAGEPVSDWASLKQGKRKFLILQGNSATIEIPEGMVDYVVTDPPYYDSVQYSDLSNFFRVWLRQFLPLDADWNYDLFNSAVSEGGTSDGRKYGELLGKIWKKCHLALNKEHGRLIFTFHHWRPDAWAELTLSLITAGFSLVNRYVVFSENPISVHIMGLKSLKHDTILVLKPNTDKTRFYNWTKPSRIDATDSYTFCRDCGAALGWFLENDLSEETIRHQWKLLIGENKNGKTSG
jgi:putative DNA methylase